MKDLGDLSKDMKKLLKELKRETFEKTKGAALASAKALILATPVDTSNALSNWRVSAGFPKTKEIPPFVRGKKGSTWLASTAAAIRESIKSLEKAKVGQQIYITNNVEYIEYLNEGSSDQAPPGWIQEIGRIAAKNYTDKHPLNLKDML